MNLRRGIELKSNSELAIMREAGKINALALLTAVSVADAGVPTADIDAAAAEVLHKHGAKPAFLGYPGPYPYPAVTNISINDELVHGIPGKRRIKQGDLVSIDCGNVFEGFVADSALTIGIGEISTEAQKLMDVTLDSLFAGIEKMVPENKSGDVSSAIQTMVEKHGFNVVREYTGHGVGRHMHEDPQIPNYGVAGKGVHLRVGMTIALEPMVLSGNPETKIKDDQWTVASMDGKLTAHYEHSIAITPEGPKVLTALDHNLDLGSTFRYNNYFAGKR